MFLTITEFNNQLKQSGTGLYPKYIQVTMAGVQVKVKNTLGIKTFRRHGTRCACCGIEAVGYMLDEHANGNRDIHPKLTLIAYAPNGKKIRFTCDHIIPKAKGGAKVAISNLQPMCSECNTKKGAMMPSEQILGKKWWNDIDPVLFANEPNPYLLTTRGHYNGK